MFNGSYFGARYFAARYFPKLGGIAAAAAAILHALFSSDTRDLLMNRAQEARVTTDGVSVVHGLGRSSVRRRGGE